MKKFDPKTLPYLTAIATSLMLTRAGVNHFGIWGWAIGPIAGLASGFALVIAGSKINDIAQRRKVLAYIALGLLMILSPLVIYFSEPSPDMGTVMWAMFPDAAILLASTVTGKSLLVQDSPQVASKPSKVAGKKGGKKPQVARKSVKEADLIAYLLANKQASQQQVADHFGITRSAIGQRIAKLVSSGRLKLP